MGQKADPVVARAQGESVDYKAAMEIFFGGGMEMYYLLIVVMVP